MVELFVGILTRKAALCIPVILLTCVIRKLMTKPVGKHSPASSTNDEYLLCKVNSSCNTKLWLEELEGDPDEQFLSDGLQNGFQLIPTEAILRPAEMNNYKSATGPEVRDKIEQTLLEEVACGNDCHH